MPQELTQDLAEHLLSPAGRTLLAEADALRADGNEALTALTRLRRSATPDQSAAAWEMSELRRRGQTKFGPSASKMFFVREALEQASGPGAADYHAARLAASGARAVADLGGGIGGDALAFARAGLSVMLFERDAARALFARENARACGLEARVSVTQADATRADWDADAAWLDPARRRNSRRVSDPEDYAPPLSWLSALGARGIGSVGVKLSPAIDHGLAQQYGAELEFLSDGGECREALLWLGAARTEDKLRATVLTGEGRHTLAGVPDVPQARPPTSGRYLYEPDPAVIRAHLVGTLADRIDAAPADPRIAYLLGDRLAFTPFADAYEVCGRFPYGKKRLQEALTALGVGRVVIKKRGFPQEPDEMRRRLKLRGDGEMTVVLARIGAGHDVFLCHPVTKPSPESL